MILNRNPIRQAGRAGVTLVELLVVAAIVLIMAGAATLAIMRYMDEAKEDRARTDIRTLSLAAETFLTRNAGNPPESFHDILKYVKGGNESHLVDPWGKQYQMRLDTDANGTAIVIVYTTTPEGKEITSVDRF